MDYCVDFGWRSDAIKSCVVSDNTIYLRVQPGNGTNYSLVLTALGYEGDANEGFPYVVSLLNPVQSAYGFVSLYHDRGYISSKFGLSNPDAEIVVDMLKFCSDLIAEKGWWK